MISLKYNNNEYSLACKTLSISTERLMFVLTWLRYLIDLLTSICLQCTLRKAGTAKSLFNSKWRIHPYALVQTVQDGLIQNNYEAFIIHSYVCTALQRSVHERCCEIHYLHVCSIYYSWCDDHICNDHIDYHYLEAVVIIYLFAF